MSALVEPTRPAQSQVAADVARPRVLVFSQLYPHAGQPGAGLFVRERMARVAQRLPVTVVSPAAWFPLQGLIRRFRPHFRSVAPHTDRCDGIDVFCPRWLSVPGFLKGLDGYLLALGSLPTVRRLCRERGIDIIDAHFGYPDGYAATLLGQWLRLPVTVTLRGNEARAAATRRGRRQLRATLRRATHVFTVSDSLRRVAVDLGIAADKVTVVPNGVDTERFRRVDRDGAREALGLPRDVPVLVSVGTLVERKGFHRVIDLLPQLRERHPGLVYLVAGGGGPEGDDSAMIRQHVQAGEAESCVRFLGPVPPDDLHRVMSAADVFVLATRGEGWANVFLEAMACGLPVVTTDVGGNREVVADEALGFVVPLDDASALREAVDRAIVRHWDRERIRDYALRNEWDGRIVNLVDTIRSVARSVVPGIPPVV